MFDKEDYYSVGALQVRVQEFTIPEDVKTFFTDDLLLGPVHNKIVEYLLTSKRDFYRELGYCRCSRVGLFEGSFAQQDANVSSR
jgi:hypothetical protein